MAKITQVTIIDENTLRLEVDASKGDEIDLLSLKEIDTSSLRRRIEEGKEQEYQKQLEKENIKFKLELNNALMEQATKLNNFFNNNIKEKEQQLLKLQTEKEELIKSINDKASIIANEEVKQYIEKINNLQSEKLKQDQSYQIEIINLKNEIQTLKSSLDDKVKVVENQKIVDLKTQEQLYKETIAQLELKYTTTILEKDNEILRIKNDRTSLNVKKIGEDLEKWCNNEFNSYANTGFITSTWIKDNQVVREAGDKEGTKADYVFSVYDTEEHNTLITSVVCEMKSEDFVSNNKKKNSSHYAKLENDRIKKGCEYSLLISELEWDQANDIPIKRIREYPNMYMVRPQYFITFLTVIESLAKKYQEIILKNKIDEIKFENSIKIIETFNTFKQDLLEKSITKIIKSVEDIKKQATNINKAADAILDTSNKIIDFHIETMKNKIDKFDIKKIVKSINKIEDNMDN